MFCQPEQRFICQEFYDVILSTTGRMSTIPISERYKAAVENNKIPTRISIPNEHFVSNVLPGRTSSSTKRLRTLKKILTPNELSHYTMNFNGRQLNRHGLPTSGRGARKKKNRRNRKGKGRRRTKKRQ